LVDLVAATKVPRIKATGFLREVHHDRAGLEDADRRPADGRRMVHERRHAVVRTYSQELIFELIALADVAGHDVVRRPQLFQ